MISAVDRISVIVTCYQEGDLLRRALDSLRRQSCQDFSTLIINDASQCDVTNRICADAADEGIAAVHRSKRNGGLSQSRNTGFEMATTEWCMFLDGDDELPDQAVETVLEAIEQHPNADFIFGDYLRTDVETEETQLVDCGVFAAPDGTLVPKALLSRWFISGHSPCRKRTWKRVGGYQQRFSYGYQDVDFYMRALAAGCVGKYVHAPIYHWHRALSGMNATRHRRTLFYQGYSWRYYQELGGQDRCWDEVVRKFLESRGDRACRADARKLLLRMFPDRRDRAPAYLKFALLTCGPQWLDRLLSNRPND